MSSQQRNDGFTLIEILIGMALLSIIMMLLFSVFRVGVRSWDSGEKKATETNQQLIVQSFIRSQLARTRPLYDNFDDDNIEGEPVFSFAGTESSVQFVSAFQAREGLRKFSFFFDPRGEGSLKVSVDPFFATFDQDIGHEELTLIEPVDLLTISYFGQETAEDDPEWSDSWEDRRALPLLVKFEIQLSRDETQQWPPLIVRLRNAESLTKRRSDQ